MALLFEEQTHLLRECFFAVQNEVGLGRREEAYHQACKLWLAEKRLPVASKPPQRLLIDGAEAYTLFPDFVGWNAISIEIKALPHKLATSEWVEVVDYLKCRGDSLGLLVNFGLDRVHVERIVYEPRQTTLLEDWKVWSGTIQGADRDAGMAVRDALHSIYSAHSTGYGTEVISKLLPFALKRRGLAVVEGPIAKSYFHDIEVHESPLDCLVIDGRILLVYTALFDSNEFNVSRGLSYMKALGLAWGVAVNFGKDQATITGLRAGLTGTKRCPHG